MGEYAVGHNVAADGDETCVRTCWIPDAKVERVAPAEMSEVTLGMDALAGLQDGADAKAKLMPLVDLYREWIRGQQALVPGTPAKRQATGRDLLNRAGVAADRIAKGIDLLDQPDCLTAFQVANRAMATAARRRFGPMQNKTVESVQAPEWRPFQLAFLLMNLPGIADPASDDREVVDLLFFPTGGGKTEAYLGLAAFTLVLRRLRNPGVTGAGLSVLMRYTLRLLTLDQLSRAATLICALELERREDAGRSATGRSRSGFGWDGRRRPTRWAARTTTIRTRRDARTIAFWNDDRKPSPDPAGRVSLVRHEVQRESFRLAANGGRTGITRPTCGLPA